MTQRNLDNGISELRQSLIGMAGFVEKAIDLAIQSWRVGNAQLANQVYQIEETVNQTHKHIDATCFQLLATQQPMAIDLRMILAVLKINNDLERMVDQAVNVASNAEFFLKAQSIIQLVDLSTMADEVKAMVHLAIDAFLKTDEKLAREVCLKDDSVDELKNKIFCDILDQIKKDVTLVDPGLNIILIARNLERIGDHATNIAEDVIFTVSGQDIRHTPKEKP